MPKTIRISLSLMFLMIPILFSGCALFKTSNIQAPQVELIKGQSVTLPPPSVFQKNITATQILTATYGQDTYSSQVEVELSPQKLVLVALAGWGGEVFSIVYDGQNIQSSSLPMPHASMGISHTLMDFVLTYAPEDSVKTMLLNTGVTLSVTPLKRTYWFNGKKILSIDYQYPDPWKGSVILHNLYFGYKINIQTLSNTV